MHTVLGIMLIVGFILVALALAFWSPTLPTVKSSTQKGYGTTMDNDNTGTDEMLTDPNDFSGDDDFRRMVDNAFDLKARYTGVSTDDILRALAAAVAEGDQR